MSETLRAARRGGARSSLPILMAAGLVCLAAAGARAQDYATTSPQGYGFKIYHVESGLYPFVQAYFRTFNERGLPLINLNYANLGVMVKGRSYSPRKGQYRIESLRNREEAIRSILVIDCSQSMRGAPFEGALRAAARYVDSKRPQDEIAILAIRDTSDGYELVSGFDRDAGALGRRLADLEPDGMSTRLYDALGAAMQMSGMVSQGTPTPGSGDYIVSTSIVVFSDGRDEGSALSRSDLNTRISSMPIPIPIYSVAYSKISQEYFKNLEALSKNSFGRYYNVGQAFDEMQKVVDEIQHVLQNDYVVVFRSYLPVDGESHAFKVGLEYPSGSGKVNYQSGRFEALEPPPLKPIQEYISALDRTIQKLPDQNPYATSRPPVATSP